jgi:hypothetical protein
MPKQIQISDLMEGKKMSKKMLITMDLKDFENLEKMSGIMGIGWSTLARMIIIQYFDKEKDKNQEWKNQFMLKV